MNDEVRRPRRVGSEIPEIVCLCGSTRFWREFQRQSLRLTLEGKIVVSIGAASGTDDKHFGNLDRAKYDRVKTALDELHLRKIDLADSVLVLNLGGYIGESTRREIEYAERTGKPVFCLENALTDTRRRSTPAGDDDGARAALHSLRKQGVSVKRRECKHQIALDKIRAVDSR